MTSWPSLPPFLAPRARPSPVLRGEREREGERVLGCTLYRREEEEEGEKRSALVQMLSHFDAHGLRTCAGIAR
jgi:hypothetical protein